MTFVETYNAYLLVALYVAAAILIGAVTGRALFHFGRFVGESSLQTITVLFFLLIAAVVLLPLDFALVDMTDRLMALLGCTMFLVQSMWFFGFVAGRQDTLAERRARLGGNRCLY